MDYAKIENISVVGGEGDYRFDVSLGHDATMYVFASVDLLTGVLKIDDIWTKAGNHPLTFDARSRNNSPYYNKAIRLGPVETRKLLRFIVETANKFTKIKSIEGSRMTGARAFSDKRDASITL